MIVTAVGGFATLFYIRYLTKKIYHDFKDEYFVGIFGMLTGVASTGIALLKGLDRNLDSPVAEELVLGSGTAITMAIPLFGFLMLPSLGCLVYFIVMFTILMVRSRKKHIE